MKPIPIDCQLESRAILKKLSLAHKSLGELKGVVRMIPHPEILVSTLSLQEAKSSSAIENIVTTNDELFQSDHRQEVYATVAAKGVRHYARALIDGFDRVKATQLLTCNQIVDLHAMIDHRSGFRKVPGTKLLDHQGKTVYTPPQSAEEVQSLMTDLERFINDPSCCDWDPLTKMAVIHHQFESIHPFYDGNGRVGRILNILYLTLYHLLDQPILYLSRYINQDKARYYRLLQETRESGHWEPWILYILDGIEQTSIQTTQMVRAIKGLMDAVEKKMRSQDKKLRLDLVTLLFQHPYTRIEYLIEGLAVSRQTASGYLAKLVDLGILTKVKKGKHNYYLNGPLIQLLAEGPWL